MKFTSAIAVFLLSCLQVNADNSTYCLPGWYFETQSHSCFSLSSELLVFDDAMKYCEDQGATLAQFMYYMEITSLSQIFEGSLLAPWIGVRKNENGVYVNLDGSSPFNAWLATQPNKDNDCVVLRTVGPVGMRTEPCYSLQPALCMTPASTCNGGVFGSSMIRSGNITSPNYPNQYFNNLNCSYYINAPAGMYITINFNPWFVETFNDYVNLYDGNSTSSPSLGQSYESTGNQLLFQFITNRVITEKGWLATWAAKLDQPDIKQSGESGNFSSPNYPSLYPAYSEQFYYITGPVGFKVNVTFVDFVTEAAADFLYVYDSATADANHQIAKLAGQPSTPFSLTSSSNTLTLKFTSDMSIQYRGFNASWAIF